MIDFDARDEWETRNTDILDMFGDMNPYSRNTQTNDATLRSTPC